MKIAVAALASTFLAACAQLGGPETGAAGSDARHAAAPAKAEQLAQRRLMVDTHIDVPYRLYRDNNVDVGRETEGGEFDFPRAKAGGLDALFMSIYIPASVDEAGDAGQFAEDLIDGVRNLAEDNPEKFALATCTTDVLAAKAKGLVAMPMGMENGGPIAGDIDNLDHFRERGVRYITLTHSKSNHIADSSYDDNERWGGLSEFGKRLIPAMNQRGVMVDVSHISDAAFWQVMKITKVPVIASHSSMRHFTPGFQRNMSDAMVAALRDNGGVIQINFGSGFLTRQARDYATAMSDARTALLAEPGISEDDPRVVNFSDDYRRAHPYPYAEVNDVLDHIDRAVRVAGIDHVGLGSDYDGVGDSLPVGLKDVSDYPNLVAGLLRRGYDDDAIAKILGGNLMRVWRDVETYAAESGYPPLCSARADDRAGA